MDLKSENTKDKLSEKKMMEYRRSIGEGREIWEKKKGHRKDRSIKWKWNSNTSNTIINVEDKHRREFV